MNKRGKKKFDLLSSKYDNFRLIGDLNAEPTEATVSAFCEIFSLKHLIKDTICFKNLTKPICIELNSNKQVKMLPDTRVIKTG